jgi:opacity protein-like surface antigen
MLTRRLSLLLSGLVCSSMSYAGEGFYVGAAATYNQVDSKLKYSNRDFTVSPPLTFTYFDKNIDESNAGGKVSAGYQWLIPLNQMLTSFALEGYANFWSKDVKETSPTLEPVPGKFNASTFEYRFQNSFGITAKPGIFLTNNLLAFGEIGADYMLVKDIELDKGPLYTTSPGISRFQTFDNSNLWGLRLGAGLQYLVTKQISVEAAWSFTFFTSDIVNENVIAALPDFGGNVELSGVGMSQATLGINYYFGY